MASVFTGPRFTQARRLAAFVASFVLVTGLLGALAPGALGAGVQPAQTVGANSCIGQDACSGARGPIGDSSCNGDQACFNNKGVVADDSCNGDQACMGSARVSRFADDTCNGERACAYVRGTIARNSCHGPWTCYMLSASVSQAGHVGRGSCWGSEACAGMNNLASIVGRGSCIGDQACIDHSGPWGIGDNSCRGFMACGLSRGPVGNNSCVGEGACDQGYGVAGDNSCNGDYSCWGITGGVGDNSCNGFRACLSSGGVGDCANNMPGYVPRACLENGYLPDGRIRRGTGAYIGNDIYDATGAREVKTVAAAPGSTITFGISVQNDSAVHSDSFTLLASGTASDMYKVTYFKGTTNITAAIVAGTYTTPALAPGATYLITAKVKVTASAAAGSSVTRVLTITSLGDGTKQDAVVFIGGVAGP